ncbi:hypothetical protein FXV83_15870 [Bradyrhizobium hipponense]|uniref:Uncharacterized protein n=1 Tax=Bradyrhizobium hipponense TaxID=2605638 RepID=A0A5S4YNF9_9BRAD|nr:hypothetical protein [Bradyrhizobium hipponense]TYO65412.1 hypothetical protein FXV83_15870 [Bradyrhizobium hipponense]
MNDNFTQQDLDELRSATETITRICHKMNAHWWIDPATGADLRQNPLMPAVKIALMHSELSEALEGDRKSLMDDKLTHRTALETEAADVLIRNGDLGGAMNSKVGEAIVAIAPFNRLEIALALNLRSLGDLAGALGLDLAGAVAEKSAFNLTRPDHKHENRVKPNGKKY